MCSEQPASPVSHPAVPHGPCRQHQIEQFWLSQGLEHLPSGILGLALNGAALPNVDQDPFNTSALKPVIN